MGPADSFLKLTNQYWKFISAKFFLVLTVFPAFCFNYLYSQRELIKIEILFSVAMSPIIFFSLYLYIDFFLIRCPHCKKKVIWFLAKTESPIDFYLKSVELKKCPLCLFKPKVVT
tara:strand:- start:970 stop:1314 length:345 start_codon:yes stop_codon:yes gene_type:complete